MDYRNLGGSGLKISALAYGNWITHASQVADAEAKESVHAALDAGITTFDTADVYAGGQAESMLGGLLKGLRRDGLELFTKVYWPTGPGRNDAGLKKALEKVPPLREEFWQDVRVPGENGMLNQSLEKAGRVADFLELGELMCLDALTRDESCGGHFREEHQDEEGQAVRDDDNYCYVSVWENKGPGAAPELHKEPLEFEYVKPAKRSYK